MEKNEHKKDILQYELEEFIKDTNECFTVLTSMR